MGSIWELSEFRERAWQFHERRAEFLRRRSYLDGSRYSGVVAALGWLGPRASALIRPLYLPCQRAVNLDSGIVPGFPTRWAFARDVPAAVQAEAARVLRASRWDVEGLLWVARGAANGNAVLRVAYRSGEVVLQSVDPANVLVDETDAIYVDTIRRDGKVVEYAEHVTFNTIRVFYDGDLVYESGNPLRAVPYVESFHIANGAPIGDCAHQIAMVLLDEVNRVATDISDLIQRHKEPQWGIIGAESAELQRGDNVWFVPQGGDFKVLTADIDVPGFLEFLREIAKQLEKAMPELAFDELTSKDFVATPTVELQLLELVLLIRRVRPNYDDALSRALWLAAHLTDEYPALLAYDGEQLFDQERGVLPTDRGAALDLELKRYQVERARIATARGDIDESVSLGRPGATGLSVMT